ncbi:MAG: hypothetical protein ACK5LN_01355 [Propioniciclava sp.]
MTTLLYQSPGGNRLQQFAGDPTGIGNTALSYQTLGQAMENTAETLQDIGDSQISKGTDRIKEDASSIEIDLRQAAIRYEQTGAALAPYATALEIAQIAYQTCEQPIEIAMAEYRTALNEVAMPSTPPLTPSAPEEAAAANAALRAAEEALREAWQPFDTAFTAWEEAYEEAAEGVTAAIEAAGNDDGIWDAIECVLDLIGYALVVLAILGLFLSGPAGWAVLIATLALAAIHLTGTLYLYANGKAGLSDVLWSAFGLLTAGAGVGLKLFQAAPSGTTLLQNARSASALPSFTSGLRSFSMPRIPSALRVNPFSRMLRGDSWAVLNQWGPRLAAWASKPRRMGTIAAQWANAIETSAPKISPLAWVSLGNWVAGIASSIFTSLPFDTGNDPR